MIFICCVSSDCKTMSVSSYNFKVKCETEKRDLKSIQFTTYIDEIIVEQFTINIKWIQLGFAEIEIISKGYYELQNMKNQNKYKMKKRKITEYTEIEKSFKTLCGVCICFSFLYFFGSANKF